MAKFVMTRKQTMVEELAAINDEYKALKVRAVKLKAQFAKKEGKVLGLTHYVNVFEQPTAKLDMARVKKLLGATKYDSCVEAGTMTVVKVYEIK